MVNTPSTSAVVGLVALAMLAESTSALPTHRSSSAITRRAHIATYHDSPAHSKRTSLGSHSVYVDASTHEPAANGGMRNSTVNLTVVSNKRDSSTLASFARVVRSMFRRSPTASEASSTSAVGENQPKLVALPQHTAAPYTKGHRTSRRQHQARAAAAAASASAASLSRKAKRAAIVEPRIGVVVNPAPAARRPKNVKRATIRERQNYDLGAQQASIYAAAVAAMQSSFPTSSSSSAPSAEATAQPVALNAQADVASSVDAASSSAIDSAPPSVTYSTFEDSTASTDVAASTSTDSVASPTASSAPSEASAATISGSPLVAAASVDRPPITMTVTLVPSGANGAYVDAAGLGPTASPLSFASLASGPVPSASAPSSASTGSTDAAASPSPSPSASAVSEQAAPPAITSGLERKLRQRRAPRNLEQAPPVVAPKQVWNLVAHF
ncbi:hypothetical protein JCM10212_002579 [Sporobolomyces blumeae]